MAPESYNVWLQTAHKLFAEKGLENFSVKEVANRCGLPRTNFYYYFDNQDDLLDKTIELHFQTTTEIFNAELSKRLNVFMPDLYVVLYDFKLGMQFAKTLFKHRDIPKYNTAYIKGVALSADLIVPKFKEYFSINLPDEQVKELWYTVTDTWYSRLNFSNYSIEYLCELCFEIMDTITPLIELSNTQAKRNILSTPLSK
jgi:AcrR family transcriptional regulator